MRDVESRRLLPLKMLASETEPSFILSMLLPASIGGCFASAWYLLGWYLYLMTFVFDVPLHDVRAGELAPSLCGDARLGLAGSFPLFLPPRLVLGLVVFVDVVNLLPMPMVPQC